MPSIAGAQDATWLFVPGSNDWNDPANWTGGTVPTGIATFGATTTPAITLTGSFTPFDIDTLVFASGAPQYNFTLLDQTLSVHGAGLVNNSSYAPTFDLIGCGCSFINFYNTSSAGNGIYTIDQLSSINFLGSSTADSATFNVIDNSLTFASNSTAANATIINSARTGFVDSSDAGNSTVHTLNGGQLIFGPTVTGGTSRLITDAGGTTDFSFMSGPLSVGSIEGAGSYNLGSFSVTVGGNNLSTTVSGDISDFGTGSLIKVGSGTLTLTGNNTYGGSTIVNGGTLAGTTNGLQGAIVDNATLQFDQTFNGSYAGAISGTGALIKSGSGIVTLTGTNSYTGATTVSGGTLQAGAANTFAAASATTVASGATLDLNSFDQTIGSLAGGGVVTLGSARLTTGGDNTSTTFAGSITGTGSVTKAGIGTFTLTGTNSYTGGTTISGGTLAGTTTSLQGTITDNAAVQFDQTFDGTFAGGISGTGSLITTGSGTVTLAGINSYSGGTTISAGMIAGTTASLQGAIVDNAALQFDQNTNGTYAGAITGTGSLLKTGSGIVTLTGINSYGGTTTVSGGTLRAGAANAFASGSATTVAGGATLDLNGFSQTVATLAGAGTVSLGSARLTTGGDNTSTTFGGSISGSGGLTKNGSGTFTLAGANSYTGSTIINAGTLVGSTTSLPGSIVDHAALQFDQVADGTYAGVV